MIRKLKSGEFRLYSRKKNPATGKRRNLGTFRTREAAGDRTPRGSAARQTLKKGPAREGRTGAGPSLRSGTPARQEHGDNPGMPGWLLSYPHARDLGTVPYGADANRRSATTAKEDGLQADSLACRSSFCWSRSLIFCCTWISSSTSEAARAWL